MSSESKARAAREMERDVTEEWRVIPTFPNYEASSLGRIRRADSGKVRPAFVNPRGYPSLRLCRDGDLLTRTVHSLVADAFIGPRPNGNDVNHIDGCKTNNAPTNLEYLSHGDNVRHAVANGRHPRGERNGQSKLTADQVAQIRLKYGARSSRSLAAEFGVSVTTVIRIIAGKRWNSESKVAV